MCLIVLACPGRAVCIADDDNEREITVNFILISV